MGAPPPPKVEKPPPPPDIAKAQLDALAYAETQRKMRKSTGRKSTFLTGGVGSNTMLGQ